MIPLAVFWFRRDLRLEDNAGLYHALRSGKAVLPVFIFDTEILDKLDNKADRRVDFIHQALQNLDTELRNLGSSLCVRFGKPSEVWKNLLVEFPIEAVYTNHDYEPYALKRDQEIGNFLKEKAVSFFTFKDQVIFEKDEVTKDDGKPYTVFTPYSKRWKQKLNDFYLKPYPTQKYFSNFQKIQNFDFPALSQIGFQKTDTMFPDKYVKDLILENYAEKRDFPAVVGTSRLSVHLRFGTISIRHLAQRGLAISEKWLNELIWREFYMMILWYFPHVITQSFKPQYDQMVWENNHEHFEAWCAGQTGYPIVDAGMRELNATGFMHNRVRMITASFLTKHLLIDWRWGEAYFAEKLLDFELASNNGGWQWSASSGCDAAPYFRIFNPYLQTEKFDPQKNYIKQWIPEIVTEQYPKPIIAHEFARNRTLERFKAFL